MGVYFVSRPLMLSNQALFSLAVTNKKSDFFSLKNLQFY